MLHENTGINNEGHLTFAGIDTIELAKEYGTPLYLIDEDRIRHNCRIYTESMKEFFGGESGPLFASKALSFRGIYRIMKEEGMRCDIVSSGELYTAASAGFPLTCAYFHGNNKTDSDISFAMDEKIGYFVADTPIEIEKVNEAAEGRGIIQNILLRVTPGIDPHTHKAINTGCVDSKFGVAIETGQALELVKHILKLKNVCLCGFHCHIGSQIFDQKPFLDASAIMLNFIREVKNCTDYDGTILNLGGGFGVRYLNSDPYIDYRENIKIMSDKMKAMCCDLKIPFPTILMEPGRSIVADAGMTLYEVGTTKVIPGFRSYVSIDGGMCDNPRYALYQSPYTVYLANKMNEPADFTCTIAGCCCESGDLIQEGVTIPTPSRGDILAVAVTGAYNYSMSSNYNRIPRPPVVAIRDGKSRVVVRRETYEDLCALDVE